MPFFNRPDLLAEHDDSSPIEVWSVRFNDQEDQYEYLTIDLKHYIGVLKKSMYEINIIGWQLVPHGSTVKYRDDFNMPREAMTNNMDLINAGLIILRLKDRVQREKLRYSQTLNL